MSFISQITKFLTKLSKYLFLGKDWKIDRTDYGKINAYCTSKNLYNLEKNERKIKSRESEAKEKKLKQKRKEKKRQLSGAKPQSTQPC